MESTCDLYFDNFNVERQQSIALLQSNFWTGYDYYFVQTSCDARQTVMQEQLRFWKCRGKLVLNMESITSGSDNATNRTTIVGKHHMEKSYSWKKRLGSCLSKHSLLIPKTRFWCHFKTLFIVLYPQKSVVQNAPSIFTPHFDVVAPN